MSTKIRITRVSGDHNVAIHKKPTKLRQMVGESTEIHSLSSGSASFDLELEEGVEFYVREAGDGVPDVVRVVTGPDGTKYNVSDANIVNADEELAAKTAAAKASTAGKAQATTANVNAPSSVSAANVPAGAAILVDVNGAKYFVNSSGVKVLVK